MRPTSEGVVPTCRAPETSDLVRVDNEALMAGDLVIQGPTCLICNLSLPVNTAASGGARRFVHSKNELTPDTKTPAILRGEEGASEGLLTAVASDNTRTAQRVDHGGRQNFN